MTPDQIREILDSSNTIKNATLKSCPVCTIMYGSHLYGTHSGESDMDCIQIAVHDKGYYLGVGKFDPTLTVNDCEMDVLIRDIKHFFHLLIAQNPISLILPFVDDDYLIETSREWTEIKRHRNKFLTKQLFKPFCGHARQEIEKLKVGNGGSRKYLVDLYGYDTKAAANAIRLMTMCIEAFTEGVMIPNRRIRDAAYLMNIRNGMYTYDEVMAKIVDLESEIHVAKEKSNLPNEIDYKLIGDLCIGTIESVWRRW